MKNLYILIFSILLILGSCQSAKANKCIKESISQYCSIDILEVHPTQFSLGMYSISEKIKEVESAYKKNKIKKYLKSNIAPAIIGPNGFYYIIDKHHTSYAILHAQIPNEFKILYLDIIENYSNLPKNEFIQILIKKHYTWLYDRDQNLRKFDELPRSIDKLEDDPYRSLAWKVRKEKGFNKVKVPYLEFYWGQFFFHQGIRLTSSKPNEIKKVLKEALLLSKSNAAQKLPGYKKIFNDN